jgi:hypothetical protein
VRIGHLVEHLLHLFLVVHGGRRDQSDVCQATCRIEAAQDVHRIRSTRHLDLAQLDALFAGLLGTASLRRFGCQLMEFGKEAAAGRIQLARQAPVGGIECLELFLAPTALP